MRLSRIYQEQKLFIGATLVLERDSAHYLGRVLRLRPGDSVNLFNSEDGEFAAELIELGKNQAQLRITGPVDNQANPQLSVNLGLGLSRGERMDYAVQKSTELGVATITPLVTERCEVRLNTERLKSRQAHWQRVAIAACEQCGRSKVPIINLPQELSEWLNERPGGLVLDARADAALADLQIGESVNLLVGPEGGFSEEELDSALSQDYTGIQLGPRILRTETAPIAALSVLQFLYGDLG
ncbi:MAG: 16S rRNA (uracil(1498)-N(3))-methyltransferase [Gammaproteobacteria bacterium]|nr:16S rRNA (uracil(1498)-N(3))-methyltransferase [Gammaproteobacteria bacterium]